MEWQALNFKKCIICQKGTAESTQSIQLNGLHNVWNILQQHKEQKSYKCLLAYNIDNDSENFLLMKPLIHKACRISITKLKTSTSIKRPPEEIGSPEYEPRRKRPKLLPAHFFQHNCFLCEKERTSTRKGQDRTLILVSTVERQRQIHEKAKRLQDHCLLTKIQGHGDECVDMIASDFRYHRSCMTEFMNKKRSCLNTSTLSRHDSVLECLYDEITETVISANTPVLLSALYTKYTTALAERTDGEVAPECLRTLKSKISAKFGQTINFVAQESRSDLLASSSTSLKDLWAENKKIAEGLENSQILESFSFSRSSGTSSTCEQCTFIGSTYHAAKNLRKGIKDKEKEQRTDSNVPLATDDISNIIPHDLYNTLAWIITDNQLPPNNDGKVQLDDRNHRKVVHLCQDIMGATTNMVLPKRIALSLHIMKQTRNKHLVTMLNKFGHAASYDNAQRVLTVEADKVDETVEAEGIFIPSSLKEARFTQMAFDNLDFHDASKDGGALHATTHVVYQYKDNTASPKKICVPLRTGRRRSTQKPDVFQPERSNLTITDRRCARSIKSSLPDYDITQDVYEFEAFQGVWLATKISQFSMDALDECDTFPSLDSFQKGVEPSQNFKTSVHYGPIFPESPTNPDIVKSSLDYFTEVSRKLLQRETIITCDQAIYDIAKAFTTKEKLKYPHVILRLGGFHIAENFFKCIGFFMKNSGIEELFVKSGLCGPNTANKILSGKDYYQMLFCHSQVADAMLAVQWKAFENTCSTEENQDNFVSLTNSLERLRTVIFDHSEHTRELTEQCREALQEMRLQWEHFQSTCGKTAQFWIQYIKMVLLVRRYIQAEREGNWHGHLSEVKRMLPYMVAARHTKYTSCIPLYLKDMDDLPETYPNVYEQFLNGRFNVHHTDGINNGVWTDMAIEQTYNKEGKTTLFKGIAQNQKARDKYVKTLPFLTSVSETAKAMVNMDSGCDSGMKIENTEKTSALINEIENLINPFAMDDKDSLVNISTGAVLSDQSILDAKDMGKRAMEEAKEKNSDNITSPKITTFCSTKKSSVTKTSAAMNITQKECSVTRALCFAQSVHPEINNKAFRHEWTAYPSSLFEPHQDVGYLMRKGVKSSFMVHLSSDIGKDWIETDKLPECDMKTAYIVDAMGFVQRLQTLQCSNFECLSEKYLRRLYSSRPAGCQIVHFIGDRYDVSPTESLKCDERLRRSSTKTQDYVVEGKADIPDWKVFINNSKNKEGLLNYLSCSWCQNLGQHPDEIQLFLGGLSKDSSDTWAITKEEYGNVDALTCSRHEEADTRMMAHLTYSSKELCCGRVVIESCDTDVFMLCLYHFPRLDGLSELFVHRNGKYLHIHSILESLEKKHGVPVKDLTAGLLSVYALSGCDTVSFPFGKGKRRAAKAFLSNPQSLKNFSDFKGMSPEMPSSVMCEARQLFGKMYNRDNVTSLDTLRQHMFAQSKSDLRTLPPTEDAFLHHVLRALYQLRWWMKSHESEPTLPSVTDFGRCISNGRLVPVMKLLPDRPEELEATGYCKCKTSRCTSKMCSCVKADVPCTIACNCSSSSLGCGRQNIVRNDYTPADSDSDDSYSSEIEF